MSSYEYAKCLERYPGPWILETSDDVIDFGTGIGGRHWMIVAANGRQICGQWSDNTPEEIGHILASSLDLLDASEKALEQLTDIFAYGQHADNPIPAQLRAAIAKTHRETNSDFQYRRAIMPSRMSEEGQKLMARGLRLVVIQQQLDAGNLTVEEAREILSGPLTLGDPTTIVDDSEFLRSS